jgi:hypothetical protein
MAKRTTYWVSPGDDGTWKTRREGADRAAGRHENKADAVGQAKDLAKKAPLGQVIVQGGNGKIQTEWTYGKDPYPPKG